MTLLDFIGDNKWVLIGYAIIFLLIYINRKKFDVEGKVIFLYRTTWGINAINKFAEKQKRFVKTIGYIGIVLGIIGMLLICGFFVKGLYDLFANPQAPPTVSPVIPGVCIPGNPLCVPFGYGLLALFFVVLIHEFGHGIVARAHGIKIKNTGIGLMLFIPLAFVEPDERQVKKQKTSVQQAIFAAGPFMNFILAFIALAILLFAISPGLASTSQNAGVLFGSVEKGLPAATYGVERNVVYTHLNGILVNDTQGFFNIFQNVKPLEQIMLTDESGKIVEVKTTAHPQNASTPYIGVGKMRTVLRPIDSAHAAAFYILDFLRDLFFWIYVLSFGIGLANLLPLGPVDGGRMIHVWSTKLFGKKRGVKIWARITWITLIALILLLVIPILREVFFKM